MEMRRPMELPSFNVSPQPLVNIYSKLGCFCFEKQDTESRRKSRTYVMTFYLDPELVNDPTVKKIYMM